MSVVEPHPVRLVVEDDLSRSRLTVFFRLLLVLPHLLWFALWTVAIYPAAIVAWVAALVTGATPAPLHRFLARAVRYGSQITAYLLLLVEPFPPFTGREGAYALDLLVADPVPQRRLVTGFRLVLAIPALLFANAFGRVLQWISFLAWFYCLATARTHRGLRDLGLYSLRYEAQTYAYLLLLTERYPSLTPVPGKPEFAAEYAPRT